MVSSSKSSGAIACEASKRERIDADHDRDIELAARSSAIWIEPQGVARQQQHAEPVGAAQLQAVDETFCTPVFGIARDQQAGRDVGAAVVLVVRRHRQQLRQIDLAMHHLLRRRGRDLAPRQRIERGVLEARQHVA